MIVIFVKKMKFKFIIDMTLIVCEYIDKYIIASNAFYLILHLLCCNLFVIPLRYNKQLDKTVFLDVHWHTYTSTYYSLLLKKWYRKSRGLINPSDSDSKTTTQSWIYTFPHSSLSFFIFTIHLINLIHQIFWKKIDSFQFWFKIGFQNWTQRIFNRDLIYNVLFFHA